MTSLTVLTLAVVVLGAVGRRGYGLALALAGVTAAGAAVFIGGIAVPTFYAVAIGAATKLGLDLLRPHVPQPLPPGVSLLLVLLGWGVLVTCIAPLLFTGLQTITPAHSVLVPGVLTSSNIAQMVYLGLGICVVVVIAQDRRAGASLIGITAGGGILLSLWRYCNTQLGLPFPLGVLDNSPTLEYIETAAGNIARFRGIFSEPSALAGTCLIFVAYGISRARQVRGPHRLGVLALVGVAIYLGLVSTSTTFLVAGVAIVGIAAVTFLFGFLSRITRVGALLGIAGCLLIVLLIWLLPIAADFVQSAVQQKVAGASYDERSGADADSYGIFVDTWGLGVGLGAGRASSLLPTVLSTTGLIGGLLLVAIVAGLIFQSASTIEVRPAIWALVAALAAKAIAGPDLSDPTGMLWISLGVLSGAAMRDREGCGATCGSMANLSPTPWSLRLRHPERHALLGRGAPGRPD